jgi:hypothetical protein
MRREGHDSNLYYSQLVPLFFNHNALSIVHTDTTRIKEQYYPRRPLFTMRVMQKSNFRPCRGSVYPTLGIADRRSKFISGTPN